jgi:transposase
MITKKVRKTTNPRKYSEDFKNQTVNMVYKIGSFSKVGDDLGVPESTIRGWVKEYEANDPNKLAETKIPDEPDYKALVVENRRLQKELEIAREEKDILKKAAAYFAQHQK